MATKHKILVTLSEAGTGLVLDQLAIFTMDLANTVKRITESIEDNNWTDETDFDAYLDEMRK